MPKVRILAWDAVGTKPPKSLEIKVGDERIDSDTEFVILASNGIWEVRVYNFRSACFVSLEYFLSICEEKHYIHIHIHI